MTREGAASTFCLGGAKRPRGNRVTTGIGAATTLEVGIDPEADRNSEGDQRE